ncbi:MAG: 50S ribosomal protein L6 [Myxococcota bacterium]|nr:50S ribosomal protein L6 [Myxococcota bacterium]
MGLSRIGRRPVEIPKGVSVVVQGRTLKVKGPKGELDLRMPEHVDVAVAGGTARVGASEALGRRQGAYHGLVRALLQNMVRGVSEGFEKKLQIVGVGYAFRLAGDAVGFKGVFTFDRPYRLPPQVKAELADKDTTLTLRSFDRDALGRTAADIRRIAPPDRYKGKGIRYAGEKLTLKTRKGTKQ